MRSDCQIIPSDLKLACLPLPITRWSWTIKPIALAAVTISLVISISARLGVGSPLGWLWTRMIAPYLHCALDHPHQVEADDVLLGAFSMRAYRGSCLDESNVL
jgi:hypothetical protein